MKWLIDLFQNQVFQTVISGVSVFILGQIIIGFVINPLLEYKKVIGKIDNKLKYYSNKISSILPKQIINKTSNIIRELSCDLESSYKQISFNFIFSICILIIPKKKDVGEAAKKLIFIANAAGDIESQKEIHKEIKEVRKLLRIVEL